MRAPRSYHHSTCGTPLRGVGVYVAYNCIVYRRASWVTCHRDHLRPPFGVYMAGRTKKCLVQACKCQWTVRLCFPIHTPMNHMMINHAPLQEMQQHTLTRTVPMMQQPGIESQQPSLTGTHLLSYSRPTPQFSTRLPTMRASRPPPSSIAV